jgi:hypothetical protein
MSRSGNDPQAFVSTFVEPLATMKSLRVSRTTTVKLCVALNGGGPSSVTTTAMRFVLGPCVSMGRQRNAPLVALIVALVGAPAPRLE